MDSKDARYYYLVRINSLRLAYEERTVMTYKNLMDLRDVSLMTILVRGIREQEQIEFIEKFKSACKTTDEWLFLEQLPIIFGDGDKVQVVKQRLGDQIVV